MNKLQYIDTARGIAILLVVALHTSQYAEVDTIPTVLPQFGQMGVQLFFVVSAFTLCLSADRRKNEPNPILSYGIRRFFRIAPAYYVGILGYLALDAFQYYSERGVPGVSVAYTPGNILANVVFLHGLYPPANNDVVPGGWSIGTEMIFYGVFPFLFSYITLYTNQNRKIFRASAVAIVILLTSILFHLLAYITTDRDLQNNTFWYFNIVTQLPIFATGIVYYFLQSRLQFGSIVNLGISVALFLGAMVIWRFVHFPLRMIPILVLTAVSFLFLIETLRTNKNLNPPLLGKIGQVSYSMYLIHFLFAHNLTRILASDIEAHVGKDIAFLLLAVIATSLSFGCALLMHRLIETPFINLGRTLIRQLPAKA